MNGGYEAEIVVFEGRKEKRLAGKSRLLMPLFTAAAVGMEPDNVLLRVNGTLSLCFFSFAYRDVEARVDIVSTSEQVSSLPGNT